MNKRMIPTLMANAYAFSQNPPPPSEDHTPHTLIIRCVDSRLLATRLFGLNVNEALIHTTIGGLVPPPERSEQDFKAKLAFKKLKQIRNIVILVHGDCGGAHIGSKMLKGIPAANNDEQEIYNWLDGAIGHDGNNSASLKAFKTAKSAFNCEALPEHINTPDKLAKMYGVQSLHNLMRYDGVEDSIMRGELDVVLLYKDLKNHRIETFDVGHEKWVPLNAVSHHFCERAFCGTGTAPAACGGCAVKTGKPLEFDTTTPLGGKPSLAASPRL